MPWAVSFIGQHNAGKTTLLVSLIQEFSRRGLKVGFLKSSKEDLAEREKAGSDTRLAQGAGAQPVAFWGGKEFLLSTPAFPKEELSFWAVLGRHFHACDLVLCEGFKKLQSLPKIEVIPENPQEFLYQKVPGVIALVGSSLPGGLPGFAPHEIEALADFIWRLRPRYQEKVHLLLNHRPVALTRFVSRALAGTLLGFVSSLRGVEGPKKLELFLEFPED